MLNGKHIYMTENGLISIFWPLYCFYTLWLLPKSKVENCECDSVNVTWTDIGQTHVTFTKFQYKYSHFISRHCIRKVVGIAIDQFGIKVLINKKINLHTFKTELWATFEVSLWMWHVCPQKCCHIHNIWQTFFKFTLTNYQQWIWILWLT